MKYIDQDKLVELIGGGKQEDIYTITKAFKLVYHMSNAHDFFMGDKESLLRLHRDIFNIKRHKMKKRITMNIAMDTLLSCIESVLNRLGYVFEDEIDE